MGIHEIFYISFTVCDGVYCIDLTVYTPVHYLCIYINLTFIKYDRVEKGRKVVDEILQKGDIVYGINTGFGNFAK